MRIQLHRIRNIANRQQLQLQLAAPARRMDGEEHGPGDTAADEADVAQDLDVAEEEEAVEGAVVEDDGVGDLEEGDDPVEPAVGEGFAGGPKYK